MWIARNVEATLSFRKAPTDVNAANKSKQIGLHNLPHLVLDTGLNFSGKLTGIPGSMKPRKVLASTTTPDGQGMTLSLHAGDYTIDIDGLGLMSTRAPGSEKALADLAALELTGKRQPRVLIGGLGLGFTLGAALDALPRGASVVVVEFFQVIVDWNRKFRFEPEADRLADPRVVVEVVDIVDYLQNAKEPFDAILLDVDNGPDSWCLKSNARLYSHTGLLRIQRVLKPGGVLAIWSTQGSPAFEKQLAEIGFATRTKRVSSHGRKGDRYTIFLAQLREKKGKPKENKRSGRRC